MTTLYWFYLVPVLARIIACIGALLVLFACYIYIQFYNYDFTISAVAEILYNKFKHKNHDIIYHTVVSYDGINKPFKIRINYANKKK